jgi:hypothetical protein
MRASIKDPIMTRRFDTPSVSRAACPLFRAPVAVGLPSSIQREGSARRGVFASGRVSASLMGLALLLGAVACQGSEPAPRVQPEPPQAQAPAVAPRPAAASAPVGLAKYDDSPAPEAHAAPPSPAATRSGAAPASAVPALNAASSPSAEVPAAADAPAKAGGQTVQGAVVTEEPFSVWLQAVSPVAAGPATVEAVLVAKPPYHCNAEYPHKFKLGAAPAGLSYPEATVKGAQVTAERSVLRIPVQAQSPGKATVSGTLQFSVCTEERCLVEKRDLSLNLEVK